MITRNTRRHLMTATLAAAAVVVTAIGVHAQADKPKQGDERYPESQTMQREVQTPGQLISGSNLIGATVRNREGDNQGEIQELVLRSGPTRVQWAAVSSGGVMGVGDRVVLVEWGNLQIDSQDPDGVQVTIDQLSLENARSFDRNEWDQWDPNTEQVDHRSATEIGDPQRRDSRSPDTDRQSQWDTPRPDPLQGSGQQDQPSRSGQQYDSTHDQQQSTQQQRDAQQNNREQNRYGQTAPGSTVGHTPAQEHAENGAGDGLDDGSPRDSRGAMGRSDAPRHGQTPSHDLQQQPGQMGDRASAMGQGAWSHSEQMSDLIGLPVVGDDDKEFGDIEDLIIERDSGRVRYAIVSYGGFIGIGDKLAVTPANQLRLEASGDRVRFHGDRQRLDASRLEGDIDDFLRNAARQKQVDEQFRTAQRQGTEQQDLLGTIDGTTTPGQQHYAAQARRDQWDGEAEQDPMGWGASAYDAANEQTLRGTVDSSGAAAGDRLRMKTEDGRTYTIHIGSRSHLRQQGAELKAGEKITVIGSRPAAAAQATENDLIIARRIETQSGAYDLRDRQGNPMWQQQKNERDDRRTPDRVPPRISPN